ncbi:MAG: cytochrome c [Cyclobacteriaceae bacterium]
MKKHTLNFQVFGVTLMILSSLLITPVCSQDASQDTQPSEEVQAATNPAGQVPDGIPSDDGSFASGRALFNQHCTACHALGKQIIGPALASAHNRRPLDWLVSFIQNSQQVIREDTTGYAEQLFIQYNRQVMPNFEFLSRDEILNILAYIKIESVSTTAGVSSHMSDETESVQQQASAGDETFTQKDDAESEGIDLAMIMGGLVIGVLLVVVILVALRKKSKQEV